CNDVSAVISVTVHGDKGGLSSVLTLIEINGLARFFSMHERSDGVMEWCRAEIPILLQHSNTPSLLRLRAALSLDSAPSSGPIQCMPGFLYRSFSRRDFLCNSAAATVI